MQGGNTLKGWRTDCNRICSVDGAQFSNRADKSEEPAGRPSALPPAGPQDEPAYEKRGFRG
jgi:hypothetical protein